MRIIITAATVAEWMPSFLEMNNLYTSDSHRFKVQFHQTGVGMLATAVSLTKLALDEKPDLVIQAGVAGCFDTAIALGKVMVVKEESLADTGVEEDGKWKDIFDLKLEKSSYPPFERRKLPNPWLTKFNLLKLPEVSGITVNEITTNPERIRQLVKKYGPVTESMEGAALHYVCRQANIPFIQIRSVSNYIGERNKANWKMKEAIGNLNQTLLQYIDTLYKIK
ncbi:MAG: futalosine hydrolase [Chitinophagaceae bacterium]|nr:futalosine hydrolase [Chitinophagaceae bacterium]MDP1762823.1 futalosine hydrolase [Sediminibacterium sp.]MDP1809952.1 futalosine hydrolase [Sediminibacterium sp.]MDP3126989.1 futalosine hydrolase [Sediminibacterium sp.]MDP3667074.1 futalosine hydrolase [Sediminibacterium sp.]